MNDINNLFFELTRIAIGTQDTLTRPPSAKEWQQLYDMAKKQSLVGICFSGVQHLSNSEASDYCGMNELQYLTWMGMAAKIQQRNEVVNLQCVELQARLSADDLRSCILKGQGVASLYGEHLRGLRQSGDIDIWIEGGAERVIEYVMSKNPTKEVDNKHIHFHCFSDTEVEAHWSPVYWNASPKNKILQAYFDTERERQFTNEENGINVPTADFQLVHQLLHVYGHYAYEGVGMRQLMDLYYAQLPVFNAKESKDYRRRVLTLFENLGFERFVGATQWVMHIVFGLKEELMLIPANASEGKRLLDDILNGGNFGHYNADNLITDESFLHRLYRRWLRKARLFRYDPLCVLYMPFARIRLEFWMRRIRKQYGL